jgi:hypothetical protein
MQGKIITERQVIDPLKMLQSSGIWERKQQIKILLTRKLRAD